MTLKAKREIYKCIDSTELKNSRFTNLDAHFGSILASNVHMLPSCAMSFCN